MKSALPLGCNLEKFSPETSALCLNLCFWFRKSHVAIAVCFGDIHHHQYEY